VTAALRDLRSDRGSRRLLLISLAVLAIVGAGVAWFTFAYVRDLWDGRHDIAVDWEPGIPAGQPFGTGRIPTPEGSRFAVRSEGRILLLDTPDRTPIADIGDVAEVAWVTEDVLVAFGSSIRGDFEGLAVIDVSDQSVTQVDTGGRDSAFSPVAVTDDGLLEVCSMIEDLLDPATCGPNRFLIDPATAELTPA